MTMRLFAKAKDRGTIVSLPPEARTSVAWLPRIGDAFPDFEGRTNAGLIAFHDWAEGHWTVLMSQPGCFTPVCTTELASFAAAEPEFDARDARLVTLSRDDVERQAEWLRDVEELYGRRIRFPVIADPLGVLSDSFGMMHPLHSEGQTVRRTFLIDPALRIRAIQDYPGGIGRGIDEILRLLDALRMADAQNVGLPADWRPGDAVLLPQDMDDAEARSRYGEGWQKFCRYLRVITPAQG